MLGSDLLNIFVGWVGLRLGLGLNCMIIINYNVDNSSYSSMHRFRTLKENIVCSKRNSQKLTQQQLFSLFEQHPSLSRLRHSRAKQLQAQINHLTEEDYKLPIKARDSRKTTQASSSKKHHRTSTLPADHPDLQLEQTAKKGVQVGRTSEGSNFTKIIDLMKEVNDLQQRRAQCPRESQTLREEIHQRLKVVKLLIRSIQDDSQRSLMDFYNEECARNSPDSFHSQNSDETYQPVTDREAYQFSANKHRPEDDSAFKQDEEEQGVTEIKYRRLSPSQQQEESIYQLFDQDGEEQTEPRERQGSPECSDFQERNQKCISHLFSYSNHGNLDTPLSKITQMEEEWSSPSRHSSLANSLQYKKIFYLLETSHKKAYPHPQEVTEFTPTQMPISIDPLPSSEKDRSRCHQQLGEMITLLQTKYRRKVKIGVQNLMDSLNLAIKDRSIKLRSKR